MALVKNLNKIISLLTEVKLDYQRKPIPEETLEPIIFNFKQDEMGKKLFSQFFQLGCQANRYGVTSFKDFDNALVQISGHLIDEDCKQ
jgi:hypothetical protein